MDIAIELQKLIELLHRQQVACALCGGFALAGNGQDQDDIRQLKELADES